MDVREGNSKIYVRDEARRLHVLDIRLLTIRSLFEGKHLHSVTRTRSGTPGEFPHRRTQAEESLAKVRRNNLERWQR